MDNQILSTKPKTGYGFIYCYTSPSGKKYIDQTRTTLKERAKKNAKGYKGSKLFYNAIQKYGFENFSVEILEEVPIDVLNETELYYIMFYDSTNKERGYNICLDSYNIYRTYATTPIYCYDGETGEFLRRYDGAPQAERELHVHHGSVRRVVNDDQHRCKGFLWRTEKLDKVDVPRPLEQSNTKKVYMYDAKTGYFIQEFESIRQAAKQSGYNRCTIQDHVTRGLIKKGNKHLFKDFKVDNLYSESSTTILNKE